MASVGVEKYSLAIQLIFLLLDNLEILQRRYSLSIDYSIISCKDTFFSRFLLQINKQIKPLLK
jgi:hypothetical protein